MSTDWRRRGTALERAVASRVAAVGRALLASASSADSENSPGVSADTGDGEPRQPVADGGLGPDGEPPDWETEVTAETRETVGVGDRVSFSKEFADADIERFALATGDTNPLHLEERYAADTRFDGRIVHGGLVASLVSAALARLPGVVIYLSQEFEFREPLRPGERVTADCEVVEVLGGDRYRLETVVSRDGTTILDGEAVVMLDEAPR
jgi:acyl dehydratase